MDTVHKFLQKKMKSYEMLDQTIIKEIIDAAGLNSKKSAIESKEFIG